jgi:carbon storage regulator
MLVLSRRVGERIVVPEYGVTVEVLDCRGGRVRLGIVAPADIAVHRAELLPPTGDRAASRPPIRKSR